MRLLRELRATYLTPCPWQEFTTRNDGNLQNGEYLSYS